MFKTVLEATVYVKELRGLVKDINDVTVVVAPPFTAVHAASEAARNSNIGVSAQNMSWEREGAFTGEISAGMIKEAGAEYVIIGHSERRTLFGETDVTVNRKLNTAIASLLTPIVCIGETLEQRERNETMDVLDRQIKAGLDGVSGDQVAALVMAYEPVWAIGTGRTPADAEVQEVHALIRAELGKALGQTDAAGMRVLYGGSMKLGNARALLSLADVDGGLIGGASLKAGDFWAIAESCL